MRPFAYLFIPLSLFGEQAVNNEATPPPEEEKQNLVSQEPPFVLSIKEEESRAIDEILSTLSKNSVISLGFKKSRLQSLGKRLHALGSLQFLGYVFHKQNLKDQMRSIRKSSLKWNGFVEGFKPGLERAAQSKALYKELKGFCKFINVEYTILVRIAEQKDWEGFLSFLVLN